MCSLNSTNNPQCYCYLGYDYNSTTNTCDSNNFYFLIFFFLFILFYFFKKSINVKYQTEAVPQLATIKLEVELIIIIHFIVHVTMVII
jgi:hypothetical protein